MKTNGDDPVKPYRVEVNFDNQGGYVVNNGLTKREHFAGLAMQGLCTIKEVVQVPDDEKIISQAAVMIADALIKELNKEQG